MGSGSGMTGNTGNTGSCIDGCIDGGLMGSMREVSSFFFFINALTMPSDL